MASKMQKMLSSILQQIKKGKEKMDVDFSRIHKKMGDKFGEDQDSLKKMEEKLKLNNIE